MSASGSGPLWRGTVPRQNGPSGQARGRQRERSLIRTFLEAANCRRYRLPIVMLGLDPSIQGDRCGACSGCRSEEHTSELQSLMRISYAVFCLQKKKTII